MVRIREHSGPATKKWLRPRSRRHRPAVAKSGATWTASEPAPLFRVFFEVYSLALQRPRRFADFLHNTIEDWLEFMAKPKRREGYERNESRAFAESKQRYIPPSQIAAVYVALGDQRRGMAWLEKAYEVRDSWLPTITVDLPFKPLHSDPPEGETSVSVP